MCTKIVIWKDKNKKISIKVSSIIILWKCVSIMILFKKVSVGAYQYHDRSIINHTQHWGMGSIRFYNVIAVIVVALIIIVIVFFFLTCCLETCPYGHPSVQSAALTRTGSFGTMCFWYGDVCSAVHANCIWATVPLCRLAVLAGLQWFDILQRTQSLLSVRGETQSSIDAWNFFSLCRRAKDYRVSRNRRAILFVFTVSRPHASISENALASYL